MHAIKKAARRSAWYQHEDDDKPLIPNPFGRINTRPRPVNDEEAGLQHTVSETIAPSPQEQRRKQSYADEQRDFAGPTKATTFPEGPIGNLPAQSAGSRNGEIQPSDDSNVPTEKADSTDYSASKPQSGFVESSVGGGQGPRKRRLRKYMPWKKGEDEEAGGDDVNNNEKARPPNTRTTTTGSKKTTHPPLTVVSQLKVVLFSWINILLVFVPVGIALANIDNNSETFGIIVFVMNFIAIIPLAAMLSFATEELALYIGETMGGLLNATFGNAVELIISIIALVKEEVTIVQTSLLGSMLSNLLLVLGMCFFFGGLRRTEQFFNLTVAQTAASLLALAIGSLIVPTAFGIFAANNIGIAPVSRGTSVLLLVIYACYLLFQLRTHVDMYNEPSQKSPKKPSKKKETGEASRGIAAIGAGTGAAMVGGEINRENLVHDEAAENDNEPDPPQLTRIGAFITLAGSTALVGVCAEYMVDGIGAVAESGVSPEFIGLILLPIVGNAAEHATSVTVAIKDKMDLAIGVAIGSSLQIALLVLPLTVLLNWFGVGSGANPPMTLNFDGFLVSVLFIAVILVNYVIQDGKSHWLEGVLLQVTYLIIAVSAWFYPAKASEVVG